MADPDTERAILHLAGAVNSLTRAVDGVIRELEAASKPSLFSRREPSYTRYLSELSRVSDQVRGALGALHINVTTPETPLVKSPIDHGDGNG